MSESRTLVVMRHAKAEDAAATDRVRRLTPGGRADAGEAGRWLAGRGIDPDHALVSAAARTCDTWASLAEGAGWALDPAVEDALYETGVDGAFDLAASVPAEVRCLVVVGHNPTMASLAQLLDDGGGDEAAVVQMTLGFPTGAVAVFELAPPWSALGPGTARLTGFHVGRAPGR